MTESFHFIKSNKGANLLILENYIHRKKFSSGQTSYWVCVNENCKGKVNLLDNVIVKRSEHCHEPETSKIASIQQKNNAKEIAGQSTYCNVKSAYNEATNAVISSSTLPIDEILSGLKTFGQLKGTINRVRASRFPSLPKLRSEIDIPIGLQFSGDEKFFQVSDGDDDKILVFATNPFLHHLCASGHVYADGTFKSVPHLFASLYTLHVMINSIMVPVVYALMPDSTMITYVRLFRIIQDLCCKLDLTWRPTEFTTDFELATIKAINLIFPACELKCCLFHFSQSLWRNVGKHGLVERYKANVDNVKTTVKRISALPFLPISDIEPTYALIKNEAPDDLAMKQFMEYFEDTYLANDPRFPMEIWNHFNDSDPRTNNHVEGWHSSLNKAVGRNHANIYQFIQTLIKQQNNYEIQLLIASHGIRPQKNRKYQLITEKILNLTKDYSENRISALEFIDKVKYCNTLQA